LGLWNIEIGNGRRRQIVDEEFHDYETRRQALALEIWNATLPVNGTLAETYLASRAITLPMPGRLRFHDALAHSAMPTTCCTPTRSLTPPCMVIRKHCVLSWRVVGSKSPPRSTVLTSSIILIRMTIHIA